METATGSCQARINGFKVICPPKHMIQSALNVLQKKGTHEEADKSSLAEQPTSSLSCAVVASKIHVQPDYV